MQVILAETAELGIVAESVFAHQRLGTVFPVVDIGEDFPGLLLLHPMVDTVVEMLGEPAFEDRKAHSGQSGEFSHALGPVVIVADEDAEVVPGLHHGLEEIGMFGRGVEQLDHHEEFGSLHAVIADAIGHLRDHETRGDQLLDKGVHREHGERLDGDLRIVIRTFVEVVEQVLTAELDPEDEREYDDPGIGILGRSEERFVPVEADALFRGSEAGGTGTVIGVGFDPQGSGEDEQDTDDAACGEGEALSGG